MKKCYKTECIDDKSFECLIRTLFGSTAIIGGSLVAVIGGASLMEICKGSLV